MRLAIAVIYVEAEDADELRKLVAAMMILLAAGLRVLLRVPRPFFVCWMHGRRSRSKGEHWKHQESLAEETGGSERYNVDFMAVSGRWRLWRFSTRPALFL